MKCLIKNIVLPACLIALSSCACRDRADVIDRVRTTFQTSKEWRPTIDNRADAVMVYGVGGNPSDTKDGVITFEDRVRSWRDRGYVTHFMTGIAWGGYDDYFSGKWDGMMHLDEGQMQQDGDTIWHGRMTPYIVPSMNYLEYMKERHVKRVIDAGIDVIFNEEPEFWNRAGYSEAFKKEWRDYYGSDWLPQHESPENTYLSNKLKYHLYYRALDEVFTYAKEYGRSKGRDIKCYVPTHSLINYSQWQIVSPEASLASLSCVDGYIAQVWTGTSRVLNYYRGKAAERVFETAFLEYGCMESMTTPTGRKMFFLTDPIEDRACDWEDYKRNYQATFTAQLLYPHVADFEVMPWPERIYEGLYRVSADSEERARIPRFYSTQMQVMVNSLNRMPVSDNVLSGSHGVGVMMSNSLMFQTYPVHDGYEDPQLSDFFGQVMPFVKRGVPVEIVHMENLGYPETLADMKVLLMSYSNMKPMDPAAHRHLASWVKKGGVLVYSGRDDDSFQKVPEWWNSDGNTYATASDHLFELMGIPHGAQEGGYRCGKGYVHVLRQDPKEYVLEDFGEKDFVDLVASLYQNEAGCGELKFANSFHLERGMYDVVAVMTESISDEPYRLEGLVVDLYDHKLPVMEGAVVSPGEQRLYVNLDRVDRSRPQIIASASREYEEKIEENGYSFVAKGPVETLNASRILLPACPVSVLVDGNECLDAGNWHGLSGTYFLEFENSPDGVKVEIKW